MYAKALLFGFITSFLFLLTDAYSSMSFISSYGSFSFSESDKQAYSTVELNRLRFILLVELVPRAGVTSSRKSSFGFGLTDLSITKK